ncbi:DUF5666 domain-containing protein [Myxococcus sp. RHSTA-1-4]|uniref:DUF5666 domain-containing protein n=1 Tax=Myxococcus sp. RHSTA-1-4 TaxID=2874601 RepID=UPI001CBF0F57|nr:DUF5666 domain-containing protein [Myxococcus sp. RHSTA-1-4]MBZ4422843.1 DUF5666 domain-containing protein [Myxococcus sp. RHSTA-1-4]
MRQWTWVWVAAGLGLTTACKDAVETERGRLGEERKPEQEAPLEGQGTLGGEDLAEQEFFGTITSTSGNSFTVRDDEGVERPFRVEQDTRFMREGQPVNRDQLREGTQIRTTYDEQDGQYVADQVEIYPGTPSREGPTSPGN